MRSRTTWCASSAKRWPRSSPRRASRRATPPKRSMVDYEHAAQWSSTSRRRWPPGAPLVWPAATGNIAREMRHGDAAATDGGLRARRRMSSRSTSSTSAWSPAPIEPRSMLAELDEATGRLTMRISSQTPTGVRDALCDDVLGIATRRGARRRRRRRRRLRHEDRRSTPRTSLVGVLRAQAEAAGQVDGRAHRGIPLGDRTAATSTSTRRARARRGRQDPRAARALAREPRRVRDAGRRRHPAADRAVGVDQRLRHPDDRRPLHGGADEHDADRPLPRRRPARGDLHHRAADGRGGAARPASIASSCAGATSSGPSRCRTRTRWRRPTTAASSRR